jgi:aromatic amino acid aminotransferase I
MLPITKAARLRALMISRHGAATISARAVRSLHSRSSHLNSAEAAAAAPPATHEVDYAPSVLRDIAARRAKAGKLVAGIAAASDSDMFKGPVRVT